MTKKLLIVVSLLLIIGGCIFNSKMNQDDDKERIYLSDKYYNKGEYIGITSDELSKLGNETYVLFTYNNYCSFSVPCETVFEDFMKKYDIDFLSMPFEDFRNTKLYETIKFGPSVVIVQNGNVIAYLDANEDEDTKRYEDT